MTCPQCNKPSFMKHIFYDLPGDRPVKDKHGRFWHESCWGDHMASIKRAKRVAQEKQDRKCQRVMRRARRWRRFVRVLKFITGV